MAQRFTNEFEEEAVRLVRTSGRAKREIADDLGVGVSTLTRWLAHSRDRQMEGNPAVKAALSGRSAGLMLRS